ncbi:MAG: hypothetical protein CL561_00255 [Alphaproteobacteria bacterium]|nr:hypothetical protein [Alphaproteobacteria bacterium]|tara:strand:- start:106 stop:465 length:360 start_codon:yes stop_codon:yes gene_type:complete
METYEIIANRIKSILKTLDKRQAWLAEGMDKVPGYISDLMSGKKRWNADTLEDAAKTLGVPLEHLFYDPVILPSEEEKALLSKIHSLSPEGQQSVLDFIDFALNKEGVSSIQFTHKENG